MRFRRLTLSIVAAAFSAALARGEDSTPSATQRGWQELSLVNASDAQQSFVAASSADPANRAARLGEALAYLQLRSRTPANIASAITLLEALRAEKPDDDTGIGAAYYLARIQQLHGFTLDRTAAIAGYRALLASNPAHHYAQLAAPKLAILLLYDDVPPAEWEHRVMEIQALLPQLTSPEAVRDTRLTLAVALIRLRHDHIRAYPLFASCLAAGTVTRTPRLNTVLIQAAESAQKLGRKSDATACYAEFLENFPHDAKSDEVRRRLEQLKREAAP